MAHEEVRDTIGALAADLMNRIAWESELGAEGYEAFSGHIEAPRAPIAASIVETPPCAAVVAPAAPAGPEEALVALREEIGDCKRCGLSAKRTHLVFGEGSARARVAFVGEGPGRDEDLAGRPFVGAAGQLLDRIIQAMGLTREQVYIGNVVKCRPPENRTPDEGEQRCCGPFIRRQLAIIAPQVVVALGATAARYLLETEVPVSRLRGTFQQVGALKVMPTYHPAYLLRNSSAKRAVWQDMQAVMAVLGLPAVKES